MKITNDGVSQSSVTPALQTPAAVTAQPAGVESAAPDSDSYTPSAEFARLIGLAKQEPAVREDRVREVMLRLQSGEYLTPQGAASTADAILNSPD
jgi:hypothetical protein